jgi:protein-arginine kinase activator protein McsA
MEEKIKQQLYNLHKKICKGVVGGKLQFTEHMDLRMATNNLEMAIELEEYEAAQIFKEHIDKLKIK